MSPAKPHRPPQFAAFVARASAGRNSVPRILIGTVLILAVWFAGTLALMSAGAIGLLAGWLPQSWTGPGSDNAFADFAGSRVGLATAILTLGAIWPGVWLAIRLVHRRRLRTLFGADDRIAGTDFGRAMAATLLVAVAVSAFTLVTEPKVARTDLPLSSWLTMVPVLGLILLIQTSAEEVLFRGYLLQSLAHRFRSAWVWAVLPTAIFASAHWFPGAKPWMNATVIVSIFIFAMTAVLLVRRTGNLGAAMGMHFANNLVALLFVASASGEHSVSLYVTPSIEDPGWTVMDAVIGGAQQVVMMGVILLLLTWRRSPLRIGHASPADGGAAAAQPASAH